MAETLLAILLVTSTAERSTVAFKWPLNPRASPRLVRQKPIIDPVNHADSSWWASHYDAPLPTDLDEELYFKEEGFQCEWRRPGLRSSRKSASRHRRDDNSKPGSGRNSPVALTEEDFSDLEEKANPEFDEILSFTSNQLGRMLTPSKKSLYHQKFELVVDDLVFIGHPVCKDEDGVWKMKVDTNTPPEVERGRDSRPKATVAKASGNQVEEESTPGTSKLSLLNSFHLVLVLDHPDPSSTASGNLSKYFDQIYEHISLPVTTMLLQEQVDSNLVENECDVLVRLVEEYILEGVRALFCINKLHVTSLVGHSYEAYISVVQTKSYCVRAIQTLYTAIKSSSVARICLNSTGASFEVQLPPYLDSILYTETDMHTFSDETGFESEKDSQGWGQEMEVGWYLPVLAPWKALLMLDDNPRDILDTLGERGTTKLYYRKLGQSSTAANLEGLDSFLKEVRITRRYAIADFWLIYGINCI